MKPKQHSLKPILAVVGFAGICGVLALFFPSFLSPSNITGILRQASMILVSGLGFTFVLAMGGFDLSVGAIASCAGVVAAILLSKGQSLGASLAVGVILGTVFGAVNGLFVVALGMPDIIGTLSTMMLVTGIQFALTEGGMPIYLFGTGVDSFFKLGQGHFAGIPVPAVIAVVLVGICLVVVHRTRYGFRLYAIGGNPRAALVQGIPLKALRWSAFIVGGTLAALCGLLVASYAGSGTVQGADQYLFLTIISVYVGTILSPSGLVSVWGAIYGAVFVAVLSNVLAMLQVPYYGDYLFKGFLLFVVVLLSRTKYKQG